ncbi:MAG: 23S rRNA (guanosine(2251)-2'-O)-methyltransferase RlmB, partial [bacterium]
MQARMGGAVAHRDAPGMARGGAGGRGRQRASGRRIPRSAGQPWYRRGAPTGRGSYRAGLPVHQTAAAAVA